jgi:8-oxo-dGTP diphosphatase
METIKQEIKSVFGEKLRLRVSGICIENDTILLVKHIGIGKTKFLWAPPGGGLSFEETVDECLKREFLEETGLTINIRELLFVNEYFEHPLHAVELFFLVERISGELIKGIDPEMGATKQIITEVCFVPFSEIKDTETDSFHSLFETFRNKADFDKKGCFMQNIIKR